MLILGFVIKESSVYLYKIDIVLGSRRCIYLFYLAASKTISGEVCMYWISNIFVDLIYNFIYNNYVKKK